MDLLTGWLFLGLSIAGHTEWWVMAVNRSHALPIKSTRLRKFRAVHDVAVAGYPVLLVCLTGFGDHSLLSGGSFSDQTRMVRILLSVTIAGCIPLVAGIIRWYGFRRHRFHHADSGDRHNVLLNAQSAAQIGDVRGRQRMLARIWPWNEIYHLEVNTKSTKIPSRTDASGAAGSRPLRIVHFSDLHFTGCPGEGYYRYLVSQAEQLRPDAFVFTGDLIDEIELLPMAVEILRPLTAIAPCFFILGNHDWRYDFELIRQTLTASGWRCVTGIADIVTLNERRVLIAGSERPWMGSHPPMVRDAGGDVRLLLSHSPDQIRFAQRCGYDVMLSGHTHGGQIVLPLIGPVYAPSIYGVSFASGLFRLGSLTLHVSRGVGARDPLRWGCCPELTCLEIHC